MQEHAELLAKKRATREAMQKALALQAEARKKIAQSEALLAQYGLADVPPQPTPPQKGAEATPTRRVRAMSAYQSNVKVEQLAEGRSAPTPGSIVASSTTSGNKESAPHPQPPGRGALRAAAPRRLRQAQPVGCRA